MYEPFVCVLKYRLSRRHETVKSLLTIFKLWGPVFSIIVGGTRSLSCIIPHRPIMLILDRQSVYIETFNVTRLLKFSPQVLVKAII